MGTYLIYLQGKGQALNLLWIFWRYKALAFIPRFLFVHILSLLNPNGVVQPTLSIVSWNYFKGWLTLLIDKCKSIFDVKNFFGSGYFLTFFSDLMDQKMGGAKKVVKTKNQFFHVYQCKGIFEFPSHRCCIFRTLFQSF